MSKNIRFTIVGRGHHVTVTSYTEPTNSSHLNLATIGKIVLSIPLSGLPDSFTTEELSIIIKAGKLLRDKC